MSAAPLRVLLVHNRYQQPGGEDVVFEAEAALLEARGHAVERYELHNDDVEGVGRARLAARALWSREAHAEVGRRVRAHRADVVHVHNTLPLASPSVFWAAREAGAATVLTLHNYRLICPGATLFRDGGPCEACVGKTLPLSCVWHGCYRGSRAATAAVAATTALHHALGTWARAVDRYAALTEAGRELFVRGGLPAAKIGVVPNFLPDDPGVGAGGGRFALFVGRLAPEKGVDVLVEAWARHDPGLPLVVAGDGPLAPRVAEAAAATPSVRWLGRQDRAAVLDLMRAADLLVLPSLWAEGLPMTLVEAFASGLPAVGSDLGAMRALIGGAGAGRLFPPGDAPALAATVRTLAGDPAALAPMRRAARAAYERDHTAEAHYARLTALYAEAIAERRGEAPDPGRPEKPTEAERPHVVTPR